MASDHCREQFSDLDASRGTAPRSPYVRVDTRPPDADAETAPRRDPQYYPYDAIDLTDVAEV
jgi:hypothetical protein